MSIDSGVPRPQAISGQVASARDAVRVGTRGSPLARWQADWVADQLRGLAGAPPIEIIEIKTLGDRDRNSPLAAIGGMGLFTKEIQQALLADAVDIAVHSLKDLPTQPVPGLVLAAVPLREDPADALIAPRARTLDALPPGARVGTSSLRRQAQLLRLRSDLEIVTLRGNIETRLNHALDGRLDAVVLAWAGLARLGLQHHVTERLVPPRFLPAVGQGALGVECRSDDRLVRQLLEHLDDPISHAAVRAERAALADLQGGCLLPLGAWARDVDGQLVLDVALYHPTGHEHLHSSRSGRWEDAELVGRAVAEDLRARGADRYLRHDP